MAAVYKVGTQLVGPSLGILITRPGLLPRRFMLEMSSFSNTILNITTCCKSPTKSTKPAIPQPQSPPTARETTPSPSPNAAITSSYVASPVTARLDRRLTSMCVGLHSLRSTCCTSSKCCCSTV
ncbi:hypothetical protein ACSBR1_040429 [Camellia fascicularis]